MPFARYFCIFINVGLGEGSALPVGVPVPWPSATPPTGWLKCNGAAFSAEEYPELAKAYPTNKLPDLRGEFIRGWDDGRGVDSWRTFGSAQDDMVGPHNHTISYRRSSGSATANFPGRATDDQRSFDSATNNNSGTETRPRNVALLACIKF